MCMRVCVCECKCMCAFVKERERERGGVVMPVIVHNVSPGINYSPEVM